MLTRSFIALVAAGFAATALAETPATTTAPQAPAASSAKAPATPVVSDAKAPAAKSGEEKQEIGYDPKVKRDPYGNVIDEAAPAPERKTEFQKMRRDGGSTMRSDRALLSTQKPAAAATAPAATTAPTTPAAPAAASTVSKASTSSAPATTTAPVPTAPTP